MIPRPNFGSIIVVEDPFVSNFLRCVLQRRGYRVIPVDALEAVALMRAPSAEIGLVITNLPSAFAEFADRLPLLYLAALPDPEVTAAFPSNRVLSKPFHPNQLLACVESLLLPM